MTASVRGAHARRIPVIAGVGEIADRPGDIAEAREPIALMADALRLAEADAGAALIGRIDSLDIINEISWPYPNACALLCERLDIRPARAIYGPVGGQTPVQAIHEAALRIARGEASVAAVCGAEAEHSLQQAAANGATLAWSPRIENFQPIRGANFQREITRKLEISSPTYVYPLYENATRASWGNSFADAQRESAEIWARNSSVAATRPAAWLQRPFAAEEILTPSPQNRPIAWPYLKLMVANPLINQGAAVILMSLDQARTLGIPDSRLVYPWGGMAADEARDILMRPGYTKSEAMNYSLNGALALLAANGRQGFDHVELYSCFPCVPKMARRVLGLGADRPLTVAGGLTFFGAPLNNYMTHAAVAMVQALRGSPGATGLLYGQGEYVTKHHALVLSGEPPSAPLEEDYRASGGDLAGTPAPPYSDDYRGPASLETFTILFERDGSPRHGVAIALTPEGHRVISRVPRTDEATIALLGDTAGTPVGARGELHIADDGIGEWRHV